MNPLKDTVLKQILAFDHRFGDRNPPIAKTNPLGHYVNPLKDSVLKQIVPVMACV